MKKIKGFSLSAHTIHGTNGIYSYMDMVDFYGFHVGKYTVRPVDPSWVRHGL